MKIVRILSIKYIQKLCDVVFKKLPNEYEYKDVISSFRRERLLHPNFFPEALANFGYEVHDFVIDFPPLLKFWGNPCQPYDALFCFANHHRPEIIYFEREAIALVPKEVKARLRTLSSVRLLSGYWGAQLGAGFNTTIFAHLDHLFSIDEVLTQQLKAYVPKTDMLRSCFDGKQIPLPPFAKRTREIAFFGTSGYGSGDHKNRFLTLRYLCLNFPIELWCDEPKRDRRAEIRHSLVRAASLLPPWFLNFLADNMPLKRKIFQDGRVFVLGEKRSPWHIQFCPLREEFTQIVRKPVFGHEYEEKIKETKIVFNCHVDNMLLYGNMRTYEATGLGALLLTDRPQQMKNLFIPDEEIVTYSSIEEIKEKISYLQNHPYDLEKMAKKGHERTMKDHTIFNRAALIDKAFQTLNKR